MGCRAKRAYSTTMSRFEDMYRLSEGKELSLPALKYLALAACFIKTQVSSLERF